MLWAAHENHNLSMVERMRNNLKSFVVTSIVRDEMGQFLFYCTRFENWDWEYNHETVIVRALGVLIGGFLFIAVASVPLSRKDQEGVPHVLLSTTTAVG